MAMRPGYKRTEVGIVPEDWRMKELGSILKSARLGGNYRNDETETNRPLIKMGNIGRGSIDLARIEYIPARVAVTDEDRLNFGDLLFNTRNTLDLVGKVAIWRDELPEAYYNSNLMRLEFEEEEIVSNFYMNYAFNAYHSISQLRGFATGTTSVAAIYGRDLRRLLLPVPPPCEQRAIADVLSDVDALIAALDRLIAKKRAIKRGAMQQLLTARTRLPGFSGAWEVMPFEDVFVRMSSRDHQIQTSDYQADGLYPVVDQGTRLVTGYSDRDDKVFRCPDRGAIVFGDHTCIVKFVDFDFVVGADGTQILVAKPGQCTHFHAYQLQNRPIHPTGYNRHSKFLKERQYLAPFLREQRSIAAGLSDIDAEITALEARRDKTLALKKGMMQELLTGKTRLI